MSDSPEDTLPEPNDAEHRCLKSTLLTEAGFSHGFFTRLGGVSTGVFSSLNFSSKTGDSPQNVARNLAIAARDLAVEPQKVFFLSQVHGTEFVEVSGTESRSELVLQTGDIVLTRARGCAAAIRTADCVPILMACRRTGWVAACHSGWRGCVAGAAGASVRAMKQRGATDLVCAIGPHISLRAFEVSWDVARTLQEASPDKDIIDESFEKPHVDLRKMVQSQLLAEGVEAQRIDDVPGCTMLEPKRFFSYRRDRNPSGRLLSAIVPR